MKRIFLTTIILCGVSLSAQTTLPGDQVIGLQGGYTQISGHYANDLKNSYWFGLYHNPKIYRYFMSDEYITYSRFNLSESASSRMEVATLGLGLLFNYPLFSFMNLYAGPAFELSYVYLKTTETDKETDSFKPGFALKTGLIFPVSHGLQVNSGIRYSQKWISSISFININYTLGVSFNYQSFIRSIKPEFIQKPSLEDKRNKYFSLAIQYFNNGLLDKAQKNFEKVISLDKNHKQSTRYLRIIRKTLGLYKTATQHKQKGELFAAISFFEKAEEYMPEARKELKDIRVELKKKIPALEKKGITAYNRRDYRSCMDIMNQLKLIDPGNEKVRLYLPRARKRYNALIKFR